MEPVAETVTPFTTVPLVRSRAPLDIGLLLLSIGMPRELNTMQAVVVPRIALLLSRQAVVCVGVGWPGVGPVARVPNPKVAHSGRLKGVPLGWPEVSARRLLPRSESAAQRPARAFPALSQASSRTAL